MSDRENKQVEESTATEASSFSLLDEVMQETTMRPEDGAYQLARRGVEAFIRGMLEPSRAEEKVHKRLVDEMITELDAKISAQVDEVLHHEKFQQLESAWRSLRFLVDRTNFRENIKLELVSVSREDLQEDFEEAPEITQSGLYKHVYTAEYGQFGGQPVAAMIGNYEFGAEPQD
ncbi:MAG: type VI secretion system contractile sheath large subunit, partial [Gammaproteobacteria bacterium]|nr:type VI secretion system contractile sheath large subunit [Gammaproteobacteria bacterium]